MTVCMLSLRPSVGSSSVYRGPAAKDGEGRIWLRASFVVAGGVVGLFGLLFVAFLLLEYVLVPVVRLFAA